MALANNELAISAASIRQSLASGGRVPGDELHTSAAALEETAQGAAPSGRRASRPSLRRSRTRDRCAPRTPAHLASTCERSPEGSARGLCGPHLRSYARPRFSPPLRFDAGERPHVASSVPRRRLAAFLHKRPASFDLLQI